jgi:flagellar hook assembly protein FlgD
LRKTVAALVVAMLVSLGVAVPSVGAAVGDPKVVIIVGATHGATAGYRADADVAYAEARKYTSNVSRVYSPYATWAAVQKAVVGASIVVYMGHGNGWPSPYTYDPNYTTKDGFGLNATWGNGDYNNKYYGEPYVASLDMAPGAIVLLHHLCYASGNSEPGNPEPTVSVARQRADNYAAGFLKAGASAVLADGHAGAERYIRDLFTTHQTIEQMWRNQSNANGNVVSFPSSRTPGTTVYQDPNTPTSGFYRSVAIRTLGVTTDEVISAGYGDTGADPSSLVVPGNAEVTTEGAALYADVGSVGTASATLPAGTRLRVVGTADTTTAEGTPLVEVQGIDDPSIHGFVATTDLAARDSTAPLVRALDVGAGRFSPNGDGQGDYAAIRGRFTESVAWTLRVRNGAGTVLWQATGTGSTFEVAWNGIVGGAPVGDGAYTVAVTGTDAWGNAPGSSTRTLTVDTAAPSLSGLTPAADPMPWFSPNGDGSRDSVAWTASNSETGSLRAQVRNAGGTLVRTLSVTNAGAPATVTWDGRTTAGGYAPDGVYTVSFAPIDLAGNAGPAQDRTVALIAGLRAVLTSTSVFFPHDGDTLAPTTKLQFTLLRPMTVTWTLRDATGATVITRLAGSAKPAGTYYWVFDGRKPDGMLLPRGRYTSFVSATDGTLVASQAVAFEADAFTITPSDTTPGRGQSITVTVVTAEPLAKAPTLWVYQPGVAAWSARTSKTGTYTYKVTIRMKTGGGSGPVSLKAWGQDTKGQAQATTRIFQLH